MPQEFNAAEAKAELARLRAKQEAVDDEDIRLALQGRIDALETQIVQAGKATKGAEQEGDEDAPATPEQIKRADDLIRQAKVENMRGNKSRASILMKEAADAAPNAASVLEALGDDYLERKQYKAAHEAYARALKHSQNNVALERKHAMTALNARSMGSIENMLRSGGDPMFLTSEDAAASLGKARFLNAFAPGVGHMVIGKTVSGLLLLVVWVGCIALVTIMHRDFVGVFYKIFGRAPHETSIPKHPNYLVFVPLFVGIITYIVGIATLGGRNPGASNKNVSRPVPPVDLPFE
ncbi:MAG TPA: hypothetical protein VG944_16505 [Fimbriimonas sp.]|nr:hypothetical protein [Fimbriimonas sp.]